MYLFFWQLWASQWPHIGHLITELIQRNRKTIHIHKWSHWGQVLFKRSTGSSTDHIVGFSIPTALCPHAEVSLGNPMFSPRTCNSLFKDWLNGENYTKDSSQQKKPIAYQIWQVCCLYFFIYFFIYCFLVQDREFISLLWLYWLILISFVLEVVWV